MTGTYHLSNSVLKTLRSPDGLSLSFQIHRLRTMHWLHPKEGDFKKFFETACKIPITELESLQIVGTEFDSENA